MPRSPEWIAPSQRRKLAATRARASVSVSASSLASDPMGQPPAAQLFLVLDQEVPPGPQAFAAVQRHQHRLLPAHDGFVRFVASDQCYEEVPFRG
jgi:hypothetical protein